MPPRAFTLSILLITACPVDIATLTHDTAATSTSTGSSSTAGSSTGTGEPAGTTAPTTGSSGSSETSTGGESSGSSSGGSSSTGPMDCKPLPEEDPALVAVTCEVHPYEQPGCPGNLGKTCEEMLAAVLDRRACADKTLCDYVACVDALAAAPCGEWPEACAYMFGCTSTGG